jgi:hypothetical protein
MTNIKDLSVVLKRLVSFESAKRRRRRSLYCRRIAVQTALADISRINNLL